MEWIIKYKKIWKTAALAALLAAILGPWVYEALNIPAEFACTPPAIRLEGDFCGTPVAGIAVFLYMIYGLANILGGVLAGTEMLANRIHEIIVCLGVVLFLLPVVNTLFSTRGEDTPRRLAWRAAGLILAAGASLWFLTNMERPVWALWGLWLYTGVVVISLALEGLALLGTHLHRWRARAGA